MRDFGVFVRINKATEGMISPEELDDQRPGHPSDLVADDRGRLRLSRGAALGIDDTQIEY